MAGERRFRRIALGLATLFTRRARGFFIPHRHAAESGRAAYPALEPIFRDAEPELRARLAGLERHREEFQAIGAAPAPEPRWDQDWFPRLDAAMAYAMVCETRPRRILEIGAGHSTRFLARAARDAALDTEIVTIDPAPRATVDKLACVRRIDRLLQAALADATDLVGGADILFVDSSHVLMPGTDVDHVLTDLIPRLPPGALLHLHDIFLPDGYPTGWAGRGYNEQVTVAALLLSPAWRIDFASHYAVTRLADAVASSAVGHLPLVAGALESSLWLRKR